jgi:hypothetical protein
MGLLDQYRQIAPWRQVVYAICVLGVIALVVWDFVDQSAQYTTVGVIVLLVIAIAVRPGGLRGPRRS